MVIATLPGAALAAGATLAIIDVLAVGFTLAAGRASIDTSGAAVVEAIMVVLADAQRVAVVALIMNE